MSLINQVLRDLQSRQVYPPVTGFQSQIKPVKFESRRIASISLVVGVILLAAITLSIFLPLENEPAQIETVLSESLVVPDNLVVEGRDVTTVHLASVRLVGTEESSRLLLEFSQPPASRPEIVIVDRLMTVTFPEQMVPASQLPLLRIKNDLVDSLHLSMIDHLWQLQAFFSTDVRIETLIIEADTLHGERLVFDFFPVAGKAQKKDRSVTALAPPVTMAKKNSEAKVLDTVVKKSRTMSPGEQAEDLYQRGVKAAKGSQRQDSLRYWQQALRIQPEHLLARKQSILALIATNRSLTDSLFSEGLILHDPLALRKWYARALLPVAGAADAAAILNGQEVSVAQDPEFRALQAGLWQQSGNYTRARLAYLDLLQMFPAKGLYLFGLAVSYDQLAEHEKAIEVYRRALKSDLDADLKSYSQLRLDALKQTRGAGN